MPNATASRLAVEWARTSAPIIETNLLDALGRASSRGVNCTIAVSRELTKTKSPYLLSFHGGEIFVFELTQRQAKAFHALNQSMECVEGSPCLEFPPTMPPIIDLSRLSVDDADGLSGEQPICGTVHYQLPAKVVFSGTVCLSMEMALGKNCRKTFYHYPQGLRSEGNLRFTFSPAAPKQDNHPDGGFVGPVVAHVRFLGTMNPKAPGGYIPLSNTAAALVELI